MSTAIGVSLDLCETNTTQRSAFSVASRTDRLSYVSCPPSGEVRSHIFLVLGPT